MRYYLGEIYITHRKTWFGYVLHDHKLTSVLIEANSFIEAKLKCIDWADDRMKPHGGKYKYVGLVTAPI